jgi:hypothetical protein
LHPDVNIQHKPAIHGECEFAAFENGERCAVTPFDFEALEGDVAESEQVKLWADGALAMLGLINAGKTVERAGRRARLIAFFLGRSDCKNQKELAAKLKISSAAVCQNLISLHAEFKQMRDIFAHSRGRT